MATKWIFTCFIAIFFGCSTKPSVIDPVTRRSDSLDYVRIREVAEKAARPTLPEQIELAKEFLYEKYTLPDSSGRRFFQWDKIKVKLALVENEHRRPSRRGVLQNRQNKNGRSPLVSRWYRNKYDRAADSLGVERYQGIPLYAHTDTVTPLIYGLDGAWVRIVHSDGRWTWIESFAEHGAGGYLVPSGYVHEIADTVAFRRVALVDRRMQHIATLEKHGGFGGGNHRWLVRSMNPATTGASNPPYAQPTPLGIFVMQEKKPKMIYLEDGTTEYGGFTPWASRFCNGAYIHGVPVNTPGTEPVEYSWTLGTTPRSHMCVRNATSHAGFVYDWAPVDRALVIVIE